MLWNDRFGNWGGTKVRGQTINLTGVSKPWGDTVALDDINLTVEAGTFTVLLGPRARYSSPF